jgi:hypothetical protein
MPYEVRASSATPALVIYLLDVSASMGQPLGDRRRIDVVMEALGAALRTMVMRSTKGSMVAPRYRIAMLAYSDHVWDLLNGVQTIDQVVKLGVPDLQPKHYTETAKVFLEAEKLLQRELPRMQDGPAPIVCHMTDGEYNGADPEPIVQRIMRMGVPDGSVLVENIFISNELLTDSIPDIQQWPGIGSQQWLANGYARKLAALSSPLPHSYQATLAEDGYHLAPGSLMMLPGTSSELVMLGFQMSTGTPVGAAR